MRSRYSAHFFRLVDYLVETTHPDSREPGLRAHLEATIHEVNWRYLTILKSSKGGKTDKAGKVEFEDDARSTGTTGSHKSGGLRSSDRHDAGGGIRKSGDR